MAGEGLHLSYEFIIDTGIILRYLREIRKAADLLDFLEHIGKITVSTITYMEILVGCQPHEEESTRLLFDRLPQHYINQEIAEKASSLIKKYQDIFGKDNPRQYPDAIIAATTWQQKAVLVSLNKKHFDSTLIDEFTIKTIDQQSEDWIKQLKL
ncbi:MAG: hypothetical protein A2Z29_11010 [Chloroflexi bacterium RBG_16_56_11]|nr:MAG: hypothetical protein A2Z29_11010 [Chloroflexi bacterium RBG_16_56_11]